MPSEPTSTRKRAKKIFESKNWIEQREAFLDYVRSLHGRRTPPTERQWKRLYGLYAGLRALTPEAKWAGLWQLVRERKAGTLRLGAKDLEVIDRFVEFNALRDARWKKHAAGTGYWSDREKIKKAKDPEGFRARNAERQRQYRERKRLEQLSLAPGDSDYLVAAE